MGYNGPPPNYVTQVTAEELIDRITFLERIWEARATGGDYWLELYAEYWGRYNDLYRPWSPRPLAPMGSRGSATFRLERLTGEWVRM